MGEIWAKSGRNLVKGWSKACKNWSRGIPAEYWPNTGQILVKYCSITGLGSRPNPDSALVVKRWSNCGQMLVKRWSIAGQSLVKRWSNGGQTVVKRWTDLPQPPAGVEVLEGRDRDEERLAGQGAGPEVPV
jgi:hypothetical protein